MGRDGARSATRKDLVGGTCATRVTRGTIDFQTRDNLELRDKEFARKFQVAFKSVALKVAFKQKLVAHTREALKVGFKQKLVPRVTLVAHVPRCSKIQARNPAQAHREGQRGRCPSLCETRGHCSVTQQIPGSAIAAIEIFTQKWYPTPVFSYRIRHLYGYVLARNIPVKCRKFALGSAIRFPRVWCARR